MNSSTDTFDFDTEYISQTCYSLKKEAFISIINGSIVVHQTKDDRSNTIVKIAKEGRDYCLITNFLKNSFSHRIFFNLRSTFYDFEDVKDDKNNFYQLTEGDVLKIGKFFVKIRSICLGKKHDVGTLMDQDSFNQKLKTLDNETELKISKKKKAIKNRNLLEKISTQNNINILFNNKTETGINSLLFNDRENSNKNLESNVEFVEKEKKELIVDEKDNGGIIENRDLNLQIETARTNNCNNIKGNKIKIKSEKPKQILTCRVCYGEEENQTSNPLINACKCIGGVKYIHLKCLQNWIYSRAVNISSASNKNCVEFMINQVSCEICQTPYPDFIYNKEMNTFYELYDCIHLQFNNYIVFESIEKNSYLYDPIENEDYWHNQNKSNRAENDKGKNNNFSRKMFVMGFDKKKVLLLGRSSDCDLKINDITISRYHCKLTYDRKNQRIKIKDIGSKYGTGILVQNSKIKISDKLPLYVNLFKNTLVFQIPKYCSYCFGKKLNAENWNLIYGKQNWKGVKYDKIFTFLFDTKLKSDEINSNNSAELQSNNTKINDNKDNLQSNSEKTEKITKKSKLILNKIKDNFSFNKEESMLNTRRRLSLDKVDRGKNENLSNNEGYSCDYLKIETNRENKEIRDLIHIYSSSSINSPNNPQIIRLSNDKIEIPKKIKVKKNMKNKRKLSTNTSLKNNLLLISSDRRETKNINLNIIN